MLRLLCTSVLAAALLSAPAYAEEGFNPLRIARDAVNIGLNTAEEAVDLGLDTAEQAVDLAEDTVTGNRCPKGERYKGDDGRWHTCE